MVNIFYSWFTNSLNVTFFIILLALLEPFLKKCFSAVCLYRLWMVLLIGLFIPAHFEATNALFYIKSPQISEENKASSGLNTQENNLVKNSIGEKSLLQNIPTKDIENENNNFHGLMEYYFIQLLSEKITYIIRNRLVILSLLWILGAALLLTVKGMQYCKYLKRLKRFMIPLSQEELKKLYSKYIPLTHYKYTKWLLLCSNIIVSKCAIITSPMTIVIFKPIILLPDEFFSNRELRFIIDHELTHIRRKDSLGKINSVICFDVQLV